jgi:hypothetical protein
VTGLEEAVHTHFAEDVFPIRRLSVYRVNVWCSLKGGALMLRNFTTKTLTLINANLFKSNYEKYN